MAMGDTTKTYANGPQTGLASGIETESDKGKTDQAKEAAAKKAQELKETATEKVRPKLEETREEGRRNLESTARALRNTADHLRDEDQAAMARYTDWAAGQVDSAAGYFRDRNVEDVVRDARSMARGNPGMFMGGALVAGFMAARFLKASEPSR